MFFFCLLFYTLYIYICGRAPCLAVSVLITHHHTTLHTTRTMGVAFGASWTLFASLPSLRENREFTEERAGGSEFSILRGCVFESTLGASPCENRESVDRDPRVHAGVPSAAGVYRANRGFGAVFVRRTSLKVNYLRVPFGRCLQSVWMLKCLLSTIYFFFGGGFNSSNKTLSIGKHQNAFYLYENAKNKQTQNKNHKCFHKAIIYNICLQIFLSKLNVYANFVVEISNQCI